MAATRAALEARARIVREIRAYFEAQGFLEVSTPARVRSPGQEVHLDAIAAGSDGEGHWLVTSPEYHLKRLVAAGLPRIFEIARCWRADETGPHHRTEFTMLEWYRAGAPLDTLAADCEALVEVAVRAAGPIRRRSGFGAPFARTTVRELFARARGRRARRRRTGRRRCAPGRRRGGRRARDGDRLGRHLLSGVPRSHRAGARAVGADVRVRLAGAAGRAGPAEAGRPARRRAVRALRGGARAGQRVRRADRSRRSSGGVSRRRRASARRGARPSTRSTRRCWRRCRACRQPPESPWVSTG